jgi:hypothetical protein
MHDLLHRAAIALLLTGGLLTTLASLENVHASRSVADAAGALPLLLTQHWGFVMGLLGAGLVLAVFLPSIRLPLIGAAVLSKAALIAIASMPGAVDQLPGRLIEVACVALLLAAGAVFLREARQEARWNGMLVLPWEA